MPPGDPGWEVVGAILVGGGGVVFYLMRLLMQKGDGNGTRKYMERDLDAALKRIKDLEDKATKQGGDLIRAEEKIRVLEAGHLGGTPGR